MDLSQHPVGRLFTVLVAVVGIGTLSYLFSRLVALLVDADLNAGLRKKRMEKEIASMSGHYIICGVGRVGSNVASELAITRRPFVVIDSNRTVLDAWVERNPRTLYLLDDAADDNALRRAGVMRAAGVFALTADDSYNLMIALSVKLLNQDARVVVRLHDIRNENKARKVGADQIVSPDFTGGMRIASAMIRPHVVNFIDQMLQSDEGLRMEEVVVPEGFASTALGKLMHKTHDYLLVAVHENGHWVFNPEDDHIIHAGMSLVLMSTPDGRVQVERLLGM